MSLKRVERRCRLCLETRSRKIDVMDIGHESLVQKINEMFNMQITSSNLLPTKVCKHCVNETERVHTFYKKVQNSQTLLHEELAGMESVHDLLDDDKTTIVKLEDESNSNNFCKTENEPLSNEYEIKTIDPKFDLEQDADESEEESNKITDTNFSNAEVDPEAESADDQEVPSETESFAPTTAAEDCSLNLNQEFNKNAPIELYKNGKLLIKGKKLNELMKKFFDLKCNHCNNRPEFDSIESFFNHCKIDHKTKGYVTCCDKKMSDKKVAISHVRRHVQPLAFQCPICQKGLSRPYLLKYNLKSHLPGFKKREKSVECELCNKKYWHKASLKLHIANHHSTNKSIKCKQCDEICYNRNALTYHVNTCHKDQKQLCPVCGKNFKTKGLLNSHLTTHDDMAKICCKECGFIAKNKYTFRIHLATHSNNVVLRCDKCDYTTTTKNNLRGHRRSKHPDKKLMYQCSFCNKSFSIKKSLEDHLSQHTGERKYSCKYCPRTFASGGNRFSHMKRMHSEQIQQEAQKKQQMYNSMLEKQLLKESENSKSEEISMFQAKEYLIELEKRKLTKTSENETSN